MRAVLCDEAVDRVCDAEGDAEVKQEACNPPARQTLVDGREGPGAVQPALRAVHVDLRLERSALRRTGRQRRLKGLQLQTTLPVALAPGVRGCPAESAIAVVVHVEALFGRGIRPPLSWHEAPLQDSPTACAKMARRHPAPTLLWT